MKRHYNYDKNPHTMNSISNHNNKTMARSDNIKYNNNIMPDLIDANIIQKKKLDPGLFFCCTSAESSTSSQMQLEPTNFLIKNRRINFKPEPNSVRNISVKKKGANIHYSDFNNNHNNHRRAANLYDSDGIMEKGVVCSMCGDVGIAELLFLCSKCSYRPQHIYCSRSYPDLCGEASICNWCLHEEDSLTSSAAKASMALNETNVCTKASEVNTANGRANANVITSPIKELNHPAARVNEASQDEYEDEVLVKKGHGKAFEYLLLIAAQSLPQVISEANAEIKQANAEIKQANAEIKQANHVISITNPKMGSHVESKADCDLDKNINMGSIDNKASMGALGSQANIKNSKRLIMDLESKQSMELHSNLNMNLDEKMDVGVFEGNIPKRQRCNKGINASLKCRKKGLQLSPSRPNYRRYKLLADVVC